jgi:hypothetical protein
LEAVQLRRISVADLIRMVLDRRARLAAEQARLAAELAELDEIIRMAAILSDYDRSLGEDTERTGAPFGMRIAGLAPDGNVPSNRTAPDPPVDGSRSPAAAMNAGGTGNMPERPDPSHLARSALTTGFPELGRDHFEFNV